MARRDSRRWQSNDSRHQPRARHRRQAVRTTRRPASPSRKTKKTVCRDSAQVGHWACDEACPRRAQRPSRGWPSVKTMVAGTVVVSWLCRFMYPWRKAGRPSGDSRKHSGGFFAAVASVVSVFVFSSCRAAAAQVGHAIYVSGCTRPVMDYAWLTPLAAKLRKPGLRSQKASLRGWLPDCLLVGGAVAVQPGLPSLWDLAGLLLSRPTPTTDV